MTPDARLLAAAELDRAAAHDRCPAEEWLTSRDIAAWLARGYSAGTVAIWAVRQIAQGHPEPEYLARTLVAALGEAG